MFSALPWVVAVLAFFAVTTGIFWLLGFVVGSAERVAVSSLGESQSTPLPRWVRVASAFIAPGAAWLGPYIPVVLRRGIQERLKRAGLEEELTPPQFLLVCLLVMVLSGAIAVLLRAPVAIISLALLVGAASPWLWLRDAVIARRDEVVRELPLYVDMLTLALEAGGSLSVALKVATERSPDSVLRRAFIRVQGDLRAGRSRAEALRALGERLDMPAISPLVAALVQADASGGSLATVLRAQSEQRLNERFARAEKRAMEAPVRMLGPLVLCIFPCTFFILAFPILMRFFSN